MEATVPDLVVKITLPLAMNVSTPPYPSAAKWPRSLSMDTVWPPTLIARRNATNLGIGAPRRPLLAQVFADQLRHLEHAHRRLPTEDGLERGIGVDRPLVL